MAWLFEGKFGSRYDVRVGELRLSCEIQRLKQIFDLHVILGREFDLQGDKEEWEAPDNLEHAFCSG